MDVEMKERFDKMDARFEKMDARFDKMDKKLEKMDRSIKAGRKENSETKEFLQDLHRKVDQLADFNHKDHEEFRKQFADLGSQVADLRKDMSFGFELIGHALQAINRHFGIVPDKVKSAGSVACRKPVPKKPVKG